MVARTILLVEDNKDDEELTLRALARNNIGNHVVVVRDGQEAIDWLEGAGSHAGRNPAGYYVARLAVSKLLELGLSVVPDPRADEPPGHALIPEMSHAAAKNSKTKSREVQLQLAKLASSAIVYTPG